MKILLLRKLFVLQESAEVLVYDYTLTAVKYVYCQTLSGENLKKWLLVFNIRNTLAPYLGNKNATALKHKQEQMVSHQEKERTGFTLMTVSDKTSLF